MRRLGGKPRAGRLRWNAAASLTLAGALTAGVLAQNPRTQHHVGAETFNRRVVAANLGNPWEVTWGPDDRLWVTERTTFRVIRVNPADGAIKVALTLDDVYQRVEQDGLMGLALHPDLLRGKGLDYVYLAYTYDRDPGPDVTRRLRVRRYTYDTASEQLTTPTDVLDDMPAHDDHGGGRLLIGPDGKLYLTRGDLGSNFLANYCNANHSQDLPTVEAVRAHDWATYQGKILRMNLDGSIPFDNPTIKGARSHIYTYGHRNPQGLAFGPGGLLYESEHGPSTDDELNVIVAGKNYGWPEIAGFNDDRGYVYANWSASAPAPCRTLKFDNLHPPASVPQQKESSWRHPDFAPPLATFFTVPPGYDLAKLGNATIAPAGIDVYTSAAIPGWATSVLITGMRTGSVYRVKLSADGRAAAGAPLEYFKSNDRFRDSAVSPDGRRIYLVTDSKGVTMDAEGNRTDVLTSPGAILEYAFTPSSSSKSPR